MYAKEVFAEATTDLAAQVSSYYLQDDPNEMSNVYLDMRTYEGIIDTSTLDSPLQHNTNIRTNLETIWTTHPGIVLNMTPANTYTLTYRACVPDPTDTAFCLEDACVYDGVCYPENYSGDIDSDGVVEVCVINSPGTWVENGTGATNDCSGSGTPTNATCSQDGDTYALGLEYMDATIGSDLWCVPQYDNITDTTSYDWYAHPLGDTASYATIQTYEGETCGDGYDNNCNAYASYAFNGTHYDYNKYNDSGTLFDVYDDVDAFDVSCFGNLTVTILDSDTGEALNATVEISMTNPARTDAVYRSNQTNTTGQTVFNGIPATTYKVIGRLGTYATKVAQVKIPYIGSASITLQLDSSACKADCTRSDEPDWCDATCQGINGCLFDTTIVPNMTAYLDGLPLNTQATLRYDDNNYTVTTCEGIPSLAGDDIAADITCDGHISLVDIITNYGGTGAKVVLVTCKEDE
jgi:hypothetical protein